MHRLLRAPCSAAWQWERGMCGEGGWGAGAALVGAEVGLRVCNTGQGRGAGTDSPLFRRSAHFQPDGLGHEQEPSARDLQWTPRRALQPGRAVQRGDPHENVQEDRPAHQGKAGLRSAPAAWKLPILLQGGEHKHAGGDPRAQTSLQIAALRGVQIGRAHSHVPSACWPACHLAFFSLTL